MVIGEWQNYHYVVHRSNEGQYHDIYVRHFLTGFVAALEKNSAKSNF